MVELSYIRLAKLCIILIAQSIGRGIEMVVNHTFIYTAADVEFKKRLGDVNEFMLYYCK